MRRFQAQEGILSLLAWDWLVFPPKGLASFGAGAEMAPIPGPDYIYFYGSFWLFGPSFRTRISFTYPESGGQVCSFGTSFGVRVFPPGSRLRDKVSFSLAPVPTPGCVSFPGR